MSVSLSARLATAARLVARSYKGTRIPGGSGSRFISRSSHGTLPVLVSAPCASSLLCLSLCSALLLVSALLCTPRLCSALLLVSQLFSVSFVALDLNTNIATQKLTVLSN